jgi:hypothetical protein
MLVIPLVLGDSLAELQLSRWYRHCLIGIDRAYLAKALHLQLEILSCINLSQLCPADYLIPLQIE